MKEGLRSLKFLFEDCVSERDVDTRFRDLFRAPDPSVGPGTGWKRFVTVTIILCNQIGTVFAEISSRSAYTRQLGIKTAFWTNYVKENMFGFLL